jgi:hypothetical protein
MDEDIVQQLIDLLPLLIPILLIELGLMIAALVDLIKRPETRGPKWLWIVVIVFVNLIGPIIYFLVAREES